MSLPIYFYIQIYGQYESVHIHINYGYMITLNDSPCIACLLDKLWMHDNSDKLWIHYKLWIPIFY
jgi:hypothetical protein